MIPLSAKNHTKMVRSVDLLGTASTTSVFIVVSRVTKSVGVLMLNGIAVVDGKQMGTFVVTPYPDEKLIVTFNEGLRVEKYLEDVGERGLRVELEMTPEFGNE
jgi:hypothetical protein